LPLLLAAILLIPAFAFKPATGSARGTPIPEYKEQLAQKRVTTDDFLIGSFISWYPYNIDSWEYQTEQMAAAGLNFNMFPKEFYTASNELKTFEYWQEVEDLYTANNMLYFMAGHVLGPKLSIEYAKQLDHCVGYYIADEPGGAGLEYMGNLCKEFVVKGNARYPYVNLLPSYAGASILGGTYRDYVSNWVKYAGAENMEYLSHDYYSFGAGGTNLGIFADMEVMRSVAFENGRMKTHSFPQSTAWHGMRMPNIDEIRWNVYGYLAYGFKAISYFNLERPAIPIPKAKALPTVSSIATALSATRSFSPIFPTLTGRYGG